MSRSRSRRPPAAHRGGRRQNHAHAAALCAQMCQDVEAMSCALDLEWWASWLLGQAWQQRWRTTPQRGTGWELRLGLPVVESIARVRTPGARSALHAIGAVDRGALGAHARRLAEGLDDRAVPKWIGEVGAGVVQGAGIACSPGDGEAIFLDISRGGEVDHTMAIFVEDRLGGIAKHLGRLRPFSVVPRAAGTQPASAIDPVRADPVLACARVRAAIKRTDQMHAPPVDGCFADLRALALAYATGPVAG